MCNSIDGVNFAAIKFGLKFILDALNAGKAVVTATGMNTEMGKIAGAIEAAEEGQTPLQIKLSQLSKILSFLVITALPADWWLISFRNSKRLSLLRMAALLQSLSL